MQGLNHSTRRPHCIVKVPEVQQDSKAMFNFSLMTTSAQVKEQLRGLAQQPTWNAPAPANEFGLPSFSAYPGKSLTVSHLS